MKENFNFKRYKEILFSIVFSGGYIVGGNLEGAVRFVVPDDTIQVEQPVSYSSSRDRNDDSEQYPTYSPYSNFHELEGDEKNSYYQWDRYDAGDPEQYSPYYPNYMRDYPYEYQTQTIILPNGYQNTIVVPPGYGNEIHQHHHRREQHKDSHPSKPDKRPTGPYIPSNDTSKSPLDMDN